eukprot:TRINITY_DN29042_c0_g1_i1.p1 TRINITY_DN29042_c0_g1~~TRINITY_DN29042_c0_g1_i1.p1  ORF type:complete len:128 (-),score=7.70 TRINITY_DN29042_c0_g1_i1:307-690(-)
MRTSSQAQSLHCEAMTSYTQTAASCATVAKLSLPAFDSCQATLNTGGARSGMACGFGVLAWAQISWGSAVSNVRTQPSEQAAASSFPFGLNFTRFTSFWARPANALVCIEVTNSDLPSFFSRSFRMS